MLLHASLANITFIIYTYWGSLAQKGEVLHGSSTELFVKVVRYGITPILGLIALAIGMLTVFHWLKVVSKDSTTYEAIKGNDKIYKLDPRNPSKLSSGQTCMPLCFRNFSKRLNLASICSLKRHQFGQRLLFERFAPVTSVLEEDCQNYEHIIDG